MYVLDTNILLKNYKNINGFDDDIIIPITVIKELDNHKNDLNEVGFQARKSIKTIRLAIKNGYRLSNGYNLIIDDNEYNHIKLNDDKIIESCSNGKQHVFVTNDLAAEIKAISKNIKCISRNNDDYSDLGKIKTIFPVNKTIDIVDVLYSNGSIDANLVIGNPIQNQCYIVSDNISNKSCLCRVFEKKLITVKPPKKIFGCIEPKNAAQKFLYEMISNPAIKIVLVTGKNGSGKTLISMASALNYINSNSKISNLICCKPIVDVGEKIGFLPGEKETKLGPYYESFDCILEYIMQKKNRSDIYEKGFNEVQYKNIGYIRGMTFENSFLFCDEAQNISNNTIKTIISRAGQNSKVIMCGDTSQIDLKSNSKHDNGLYYAQQKFYNNEKVGIIHLDKVIRSEVAELSELL